MQIPTTSNHYYKIEGENMHYGYCRVSTLEQSIETQKELLLKSGVLEGNIYSDTYTGTSLDRVGWHSVKNQLKFGDCLIVWRLDRIGRNLVDTLSEIKIFESVGIGIRSLTENLDSSTASGKMMLSTLLTFSQYERDLVSERTCAALAYKKSQGVQLGRKFKKKEKILNLLKKGLPCKEIAERCGVCLRVVYNHKNSLSLDKHNNTCEIQKKESKKDTYPTKEVFSDT